MGNLPLVGISYQSAEKDQEYYRRFSVQKTIEKIYHRALDLGITTFAAGLSSMVPEGESIIENHLLELQNLANTATISVIPCVTIPLEFQGSPVDVYRRWATVYLSYEEPIRKNLLKTFLKDPILNFRQEWQENLHKVIQTAGGFSKTEINDISIDNDSLEGSFERAADLPVKILEFGSEMDFLLAIKRSDLIGELRDAVVSRGYKIAFGIHHSGVSLQRIHMNMEEFPLVLTPINPIGIMMFPNKEKCLSEIRKYRTGGGKIIGIKVLAGGRVSPEKAMPFLQNTGLIDNFMVGVASISELETAIRLSREANLPI